MKSSPNSKNRKLPLEKKYKRIPKISSRQRKRIADYAKFRKQFMEKNPNCHYCGRPVTELHHSRGRLGTLLMDERYIFSLCDEHHRVVHAKIGWAREHGYICEKGKWNTP